MWRMLQQDEPDDYVIATGEIALGARVPRRAACSHLGLDWESFVEFDPRYLRPTEVDELCGDASKAREKLGWKPRVTFDELVRIMVEADVKLLEDELAGKAVRRQRWRAPDPGFWSGRKVCVTGGAGFLGSVVTRELEELGAETRVVRSAEHDLRRRGGRRDGASTAPGHRDSPGRPGGRDRLQPAQPRRRWPTTT